MSKIFEKLIKEASWDSSKNKYLFFLYLIFLLVQTVNFLLFVEIRFSMGLPDDHWGIFFVNEYPAGFFIF